MRPRVIAVHGFLGQPADWDRLAADLPAAKVLAVDLWKALAGAGVRNWTSAVAAVDAAIGQVIAEQGPGPFFVVGYSLGARLMLGSRLLSAPGTPVRGACFVSCNPGLADDDAAARAVRRASDAAWAERIHADPVDTLWRDWDSQAVFAGSRTPPRRRDLPAPRDLIARVLTASSLAEQPDLRAQLAQWPTPVLWVTGGRDARFSAIANELEESRVAAGFVNFEEAGHRVPWDNPPAFAAVLQEWIAR
jgi:2-succinyl-6-hydroxy-2,4-cyclohexadiene-1-carboxylate synthase